MLAWCCQTETLTDESLPLPERAAAPTEIVAASCTGLPLGKRAECPRGHMMLEAGCTPAPEIQTHHLLPGQMSAAKSAEQLQDHW